MKELIIDEEFRSLLPALDEKTFTALESNLIENGCLYALVLWNGILIDGYNRHRICTEHNIPFDTIDIELNSREDALIWIISNQVSRRNLTPLQLSRLRGLHYRADKKIVANAGGRNQYSDKKEVEPHYEEQPKKLSTASRLAKHYKVSRVTIERDSKVADAIDAIGEVSPEAMRKIISGEVAINKNKLKALLSEQAEDIASTVVEIEEGTYERRKPAAPQAAESDRSPASLPPEVQRFCSGVNSITHDFSYELQELSNSGGIAELRTALRSYIDKLEDFYGKEYSTMIPH